MTRRPPSIVGAFFTEDGGFTVHWEVDQFFADSAEPERVLVDLNGLPFKELSGDKDSVDVPATVIAALGTASVTVSVSFWWSGSPAEELQSSVVVPVSAGPGQGNAGVLPAMKPIVTLVGVQPRTATTPSTITIAWRTNNHNDGNIFWGPSSAPRSFVRNIRPANASVTSGTFITDRPVVPHTLYVFTVEVRNTLHSPQWLATTLIARSASEAPGPVVRTSSVRQFLQQTGRPVTSSLAGLVGANKSVRTLILG